MIHLVGCPYEVKVTSYGDNNHGVYHVHPSRFGTYQIQNGLFYGRNWWKKGNSGIWYTGSEWIVGNVNNRPGSLGVMYTDQDHECPNQIGYDWKYSGIWVNAWLSAGRKMKITSDY